MKKYCPAVALTVLFLAALFLALQNGGAPQWEMDALLWIQEHRTVWLTPIMRIFTVAGDLGAIWILAGVALILTKRYRKQGIMMLITLGVCFLLSEGILKNIICRPRPFYVQPELDTIIPPPIGRYSFPSGHTSSSFAGALSLSYADKRFRVPAFAVAALTAASRLYFGVHYPTDIIAGVAVGIACAYFVRKAIKARAAVKK